jgi:hypothetical protein
MNTVMWTATTRAQHMRDGLRFVTTLWYEGRMTLRGEPRNRRAAHCSCVLYQRAIPRPGRGA